MTHRDRWAALAALAALGGAACLVIYWLGVLWRGLSFGFF